MDVNHTQYGHQKSVWIRHCLTERTVSFFQKEFHKNVKMLVVSILKTNSVWWENTFKSEAVVRRWCVKKVFLEISQNSQENTCLKCFPVNFVKFQRTPFYIEHLWWPLLTLLKAGLHCSSFSVNTAKVSCTAILRMAASEVFHISQQNIYLFKIGNS